MAKGYNDKMSICDIVDTCRYPLGFSGGAAYKKLISQCRQQLKQDGCCLLPDFLKPDALDNAKQEAITLATGGFKMNRYFAYDDVNDDTLSRNLDHLQKDHPRRFKSLTKIRFVARDLISSVNPVQRVHNWPSICTFLQDVLQILERIQIPSLKKVFHWQKNLKMLKYFGQV